MIRRKETLFSSLDNKEYSLIFPQLPPQQTSHCPSSQGQCELNPSVCNLRSHGFGLWFWLGKVRTLLRTRFWWYERLRVKAPFARALKSHTLKILCIAKVLLDSNPDVLLHTNTAALWIGMGMNRLTNERSWWILAGLRFTKSSLWPGDWHELSKLFVEVHVHLWVGTILDSLPAQSKHLLNFKATTWRVCRGVSWGSPLRLWCF